MSNKERVKMFKVAPWRTMPEVQQFVEATLADAQMPLDGSDLVEMLDVVASKTSAAEPDRHEKRLAALQAFVHRAPSPLLFRPLLKTMKSGPPGLRNLFASWLPLCNSIEAHDELCGMLKSTESDLRAAAVHAMKQIGGKSIITHLQELLKDLDFAGGREAIDVVAHVAGSHGIPVLVQVLSAPDPQMRIAAVRVLGNPKFMGKNTAGAVRALSHALRDPQESVVVAAIAGIGEVGSEDDYFDHIGPIFESTNHRMVAAAVEGMKRCKSPRALGQLERRLAAGPNLVRFAVLNVLEQAGDDDMLPPLVTALAHKNLTVRTRAAEVMGKLSKTGRIDLARAVIWLLRRPDANLRRLAADLVRSIQDPTGEVWPKLVTFLRSEDWWVRERVMEALIEMAGLQLTRHVAAWLQEPSPVVRRFALTVLQRLKDPQSVGALVRVATSDADWWAREMAIQALAAVNDARTVPYLVDLMAREDELRVACLEALMEMGAKVALPQVLPLLASPSTDVRLMSLRFIEKFSDEPFVDAVRPLALDDSYQVRTMARELLTRWNISAQLGTSRSVSFLDGFLLAMANAQGDDLFIATNRKVYMKRMGEMVTVTDVELTKDQVTAVLMPLLTSEQISLYEKMNDLDFSYEVKAHGLRFRVNVLQDHEGIGAVFRIIRNAIPELEKLGLPPIVKTFADMPHGLVLVGGPTGSGKSTTLAALIDYINKTSNRHIISLEDPIEVVHKRVQSLVNQREIGAHTTSFVSALRSALREDPDVLLVGEMRDLATVQFAVTAAETGHLVFGTVHTSSADTSIDRIINVFPAGQQDQVRSMLSDSLRAVLCQFLVRRKDGNGRCLAAEILLNNDAVANTIRKGKAFQIPSIVATSRELGMQSMDQDLMRLYKAGIADRDDVFMKARSKREFEELFGEGKPAGAAAAGPAKSAAPAQPPRPVPTSIPKPVARG